MDSDDTGNIGDSDTRWALGNFTTIRSDDLKVRSLEKERIVFISDSEGKLSTSDKLQWKNDSELVVDGNVEVTGVTKSPTVQVTTLSKDRIVYISDSEGTLATNDKLQWQGDSELYVDGDVVVTGQINIPAIKITSLEKDRIVYVADSEGTLATNSKLQWHKDSELLIDGSLQINGRVDTASTTVRELGDVPGGIVFRNANTGKLDVDSRLKYNDSEGLVYDGKSILPIDSETLQSLLIENIDSEFSQYVGLDSDSVEAIIRQSTVLSTVAVPTGPKGNIYYIDSDNTNKIVNDNIVKIHTGFYNTGAEITAAISRKTPSQYPHLSDNDSDGNRYSVYDLRINPTLNTSGAPSYRTHWQYDSDRNHDPLYPYSGSWGIDSETTINGKFGVGRLLHNPNTKKTWYNDGSTIHEIGTARTFSDVIVMENLTAPPDSDALGFEGLRPGSIAVADGVTWDPAGYGGLTPYPVFWDGGQWLIFTLF